MLFLLFPSFGGLLVLPLCRWLRPGFVGSLLAVSVLFVLAVGTQVWKRSEAFAEQGRLPRAGSDRTK